MVPMHNLPGTTESLCGIEVEATYTYSPPTVVMATTWGNVKAMFR
jgi:hypothetical protein